MGDHTARRMCRAAERYPAVERGLLRSFTMRHRAGLRFGCFHCLPPSSLPSGLEVAAWADGWNSAAHQLVATVIDRSQS